ncbi:biotin-dependent carboxylase uncharacterized domain-containing protein [Agreia bicolorata]|uniref:Biotin-dependent carboxylase uncharacterized domain-containing protein n=1 Tax=Agreia bicolorata TaxID=110935 RepID=A0A1T4WQ17_9MICO|nr:5-oxoprolinase/urea amidolyase family protein [Agreia bicolorata]SKA79416.1 biotin-dependent carboxylase uncharacterized domain-containing protein [Agreia bicolorata]
MIEVVTPGLQTTVQDYPGRIGYLDRGFYPAGPMDNLAFRVANALVGNASSAAGLEITLGRAGFRFTRAATIAVTGATADITLDDEPVPQNTLLEVPEGGLLRIGPANDTGFRLYLAVRGGIDTPVVLGSRATYTMGQIGGVDGRALRKGDVLPLGQLIDPDGPTVVDIEALPSYDHDWVLDVVPGPHSSPDYLAEADLAVLFGRSWPVDRNSNRTGIRLEPQRLEWARRDGGIAGGHPSNILDMGYPLGGINLNGDTPVILAPDGPTSGGFVVVAVVCQASMWKLGQLRPGADRVTLRPISIDEALELSARQNDLFQISDERSKA